jgi:hypothetical protein
MGIIKFSSWGMNAESFTDAERSTSRYLNFEGGHDRPDSVRTQGVAAAAGRASDVATVSWRPGAAPRPGRLPALEEHRKALRFCRVLPILPSEFTPAFDSDAVCCSPKFTTPQVLAGPTGTGFKFQGPRLSCDDDAASCSDLCPPV